MKKVKKDFRLHVETLEKMDELVSVLSAEKHIKLNRTSLLEMLVAECFERVLNASEGSEQVTK